MPGQDPLMAKAAFETPRIPDFPEIPVVVEGAMAHSRPFVAAPEHQEALGFPGQLVDDWHDRAIARMGELLGRSRGLRVFLDSCVKCGACTDKCHYFLGTADPKNMPAAATRTVLADGLALLGVSAPESM